MSPTVPIGRSLSRLYLPDGIVVDVEAGHIYWTNMGSSPAGTMALSSGPTLMERIADHRSARRTFTPKQSTLDKEEPASLLGTRSMRLMRSNLDGSQIERSRDRRGDADRRDQYQVVRWGHDRP